MVQFVQQDETGLPQKRKHVEQACQECRKKKVRCENHTNNCSRNPNFSQKRCIHIDTETHPDVTASSGPANQKQKRSISRPSNGSEHAGPLRPLTRQQASSQDAVTPLLETHPQGSEEASNSEDVRYGSRFVGDMNPEAALLVATGHDRSNTAQIDGHIGVLYTENSENRYRSEHRSQYQDSTWRYSDRYINRKALPYLQSHCLCCLPPPTQFETLKAIYFKKIHPILPLIDLTSVSPSDDKSPPVVLLKQAICLAASVQPEAPSRLCLSSEVYGKNIDFRRRLSQAMKTTIFFDDVLEKSLLIEVCTILSLFSPAADAGDTAGEYNCKAVQCVQSLGLHLQPEPPKDWREDFPRHFGVVWAIDHLNACFYGKPLLIHERDLSTDPDSYLIMQPAFQLFLDIVKLLDKVIKNYRPTEQSKETLDWEFPDFEIMTMDARASWIDASTLTSLEILYHAVHILAQRTPRGFRHDFNPATTAVVRQRLAALKITSIVSQEFGKLTLFPWVPYAISLALSVAYRELENARLLTHLTRAQTQISLCCDLLEQSGSVFPSALLMAKMGRQILRITAIDEDWPRNRLNAVYLGPRKERTQQSTQEGRLDQNIENATSTDAFERSLTPVDIDDVWDLAPGTEFPELPMLSALEDRLDLSIPLDFEWIYK